MKECTQSYLIYGAKYVSDMPTANSTVTHEWFMLIDNVYILLATVHVN